MIKENLPLAKSILEQYSETRGDNGTGIFLNQVHMALFGTMKVDFTQFAPETWTRSRRKVLEMCPYLDNRGDMTSKAEKTVKSEMFLSSN